MDYPPISKFSKHRNFRNFKHNQMKFLSIFRKLKLLLDISIAFLRNFFYLEEIITIRFLLRRIRQPKSSHQEMSKGMPLSQTIFLPNLRHSVSFRKKTLLTFK